MLHGESRNNTLGNRHRQSLTKSLSEAKRDVLHWWSRRDRWRRISSILHQGGAPTGVFEKFYFRQHFNQIVKRRMIFRRWGWGMRGWLQDRVELGLTDLCVEGRSYRIRRLGVQVVTCKSRGIFVSTEHIAGGSGWWENRQATGGFKGETM